MRVRRLVAVGALVAVWAVGAGCSGESEAGVEPRFSDSSVASGSPSESGSAVVPEGLVEPTPPAAMERFDEAGAKAFAEFYWEVVTYAQSTGDTALLKTLELPLCAGCVGGREWIERTYAKGRVIDGGRMTTEVRSVKRLGVVGTDAPAGYSVEINLGTASLRVVDDQGKVTRRSPASDADVVMIVDFDETSGWHVGYWESVS